eukprot:364943-Chlamydomonas_euryale.AAC.17
MNLLLAGGIALPVGGLAVPYALFFVPARCEGGAIAGRSRRGAPSGGQAREERRDNTKGEDTFNSFTEAALHSSSSAASKAMMMCRYVASGLSDSAGGQPAWEAVVKNRGGEIRGNHSSGGCPAPTPLACFFRLQSPS